MLNKPDIFEGKLCVYKIGSDQWAYKVTKVINQNKIVVVDMRCVDQEMIFTLRRNKTWSKVGEHYANIGILDFSKTETKFDQGF